MTRSYSDGITPQISYKYDLAPNGKGQLIEMSNSVSISKIAQFDQWGRATQYQQITDGQTYTSSYQYNLSGALTQETYPSGRTVNRSYDSNSDLMRVFGKATPTSTERTYANSFNFTASGEISTIKLGNGKWETAKFNERSQVLEIGLGNSATDASLWKVNYEYGELDSYGNIDSVKNTGLIAKQTISFNGLNQPFVQSYKYDALYRLTDAIEKSGTAENWKQQFSYDRYGNRLTHQKYLNGNFIAQNNQTHPQIDQATNRFTTGQGYTYDLNGNLIADAEGRQFTFNADNKQTLVMNGAVKVGEYFYDGDGKRVKKKTFHENGVEKETIVFVYSGGKLIAEYSTIPPPAQGKTKYLTEDHLGTPRIITDATGQVIARRDFLPFGEEIYFGIGERSKANNYAASEDDVKQKFTGYQKDEETQLDFAEARMYENRHGRFTAVDPLLASGNSANPQSFNRYVYVRNSPLVLNDPTGLIPGEYYDRNGNYLGTDHNDEDKNYYFADKVGETENGINTVVNREVTTYLDIQRRRYGREPSFSDNLGYTFSGMGKETLNGFIGISNGFYWAAERANFGYLATGNTPPVIFRTPYFEPSNQFEANQMFSTNLALTAVSIYAGGAAGARTPRPSFSGFSSATSSTETGLSMQGKAYEIKYLQKHIENSSQSLNLLKKENVQVFPNMETLSKVESTIFSKGQYTGSVRKFDRFGYRFNEPIGVQINTNGQRINLFYGEIKVRQDGLYHVIPRLNPSK